MHPLGHGQVDLAGKVVQMADQTRHDLGQARVGLGPRGGDNRVGELGVVQGRCGLVPRVVALAAGAVEVPSLGTSIGTAGAVVLSGLAPIGTGRFDSIHDGPVLDGSPGWLRGREQVRDG